MNDDLISRAEAFDSVEIFLKQTDAPEVYPGLIPALARVINNVPSAQQVRTQMSSADDLISRTQAIDAVVDEFKRIPTSAIRAKTRIEALPSAQPEIIRCKDCRWRKDQSGSTAWLPCRAIVTPSDFYCGRAERRTDEGD